MKFLFSAMLATTVLAKIFPDCEDTRHHEADFDSGMMPFGANRTVRRMM
ncbi:hypothetical protein L288_00125 [Sphingobium quisquiliarum P25]|uniref:Uncharacterized protein n=1 Tax=Sphingobium quisquiliarum P25 TaxID=1329909 RepID=T0HR29_9SPHN|nr:hypothetical protein [Sphingobium sp. DC-2]EQB15537.1 hypothetical protein L288_00125 [Sphingobium quisquiliarum P25]